MISQAAKRQAEFLCRRKQQSFARIEDKCLTYVRVNESILGPFKNQVYADRFFLTLVRAELERPEDEDSAQRSRTVWISV